MFLVARVISVVPGIRSCVLGHLDGAVSLLFRRGFVCRRHGVPPASAYGPLRGISSRSTLVNVYFFRGDSVTVKLTTPRVFGLLRTARGLLRCKTLSGVSTLLKYPVLLPRNGRVGILPCQLALAG